MKPLYFQTEGVNKQGEDYESEQCTKFTSGKIIETRKFFHDLLDEFLDSFERNQEKSSLKFGYCDIEKHDLPTRPHATES